MFNNSRQQLLSLVILGLMSFAGCGSPNSSTQNSTTVTTGTSSLNSAIAQITPATLTFGNQVVGSASSPATITFTNTGTQGLSISSIVISGEFSQTNNCGTTIQTGAACTVQVTFNPQAVGTQSGKLSFADNAAPSAHVVTLSGSGVTAGNLANTPTALSFGNVVVGQSSSQMLTISNAGGQNVVISSVGTSGAGISATGISTPMTLSPNQNTSLSVSFTPASVGAVSGSIYFASDGVGSTLAVPVTGTGTAASHQVVLSWNTSDLSVIGYNVFRSSVSGGPYTKLVASTTSQPSYTDFNVVAGNSYYYVVTAIGSNSVESSYSSEVEASVPMP